MAEVRKETLSDTDEPSLESRVADNVMVVVVQQFSSSYDDGIERAVVDFLSLGANAGSSRVYRDSGNQQSRSRRQGDCSLFVDFLRYC